MVLHLSEMLFHFSSLQFRNILTAALKAQSECFRWFRRGRSLEGQLLYTRQMTQKTARIIVGLIKASTPIFKKSKLLHFPRPYITKWPNYTQRKCPINWWIMILFAMVWRHNFILLTHGWTSMTKIEIQWPILIFRPGFETSWISECQTHF